MYNKRQDLISDFIKDNPKTTRENIELFLKKMILCDRFVTD